VVPIGVKKQQQQQQPIPRETKIIKQILSPKPTKHMERFLITSGSPLPVTRRNFLPQNFTSSQNIIYFELNIEPLSDIASQ